MERRHRWKVRCGEGTVIVRTIKCRRNSLDGIRSFARNLEDQGSYPPI